jgi:hypothetical protein
MVRLSKSMLHPPHSHNFLSRRASMQIAWGSSRLANWPVTPLRLIRDLVRDSIAGLNQSNGVSLKTLGPTGGYYLPSPHSIFSSLHLFLISMFSCLSVGLQLSYYALLTVVFRCCYSVLLLSRRFLA